MIILITIIINNNSFSEDDAESSHWTVRITQMPLVCKNDIECQMKRIACLVLFLLIYFVQSCQQYNSVSRFKNRKYM